MSSALKPPKPFRRKGKMTYAVNLKINGKQWFKNLGTTNEEEAILISNTLHTMTITPDLTKEKILHLFNDVLIKTGREPISLFESANKKSCTLEEAIERYLESKPNLSQSTVNSYTTHINMIDRITGDDFRKDLNFFTREEIQKIINAYTLGIGNKKAKARSSRTTENFIKFLQSVFHLAVVDEYIKSSPIYKISYEKTKKLPVLNFTQKELNLFKEIDDPDWLGMCLAGMNSGMRISDAAKIGKDNFRYQDGTLIMDYTPIKTSANDPDRRAIIPVVGDFKEYAEERLDQNQFFPDLYNLNTGGNLGLTDLFHDVMIQVGVAFDNITTPAGATHRTKSFKSFRYTYNSHLIEKGVSVEARNVMLGHVSDEVNRIYYNTDFKKLSEQIK